LYERLNQTGHGPEQSDERTDVPDGNEQTKVSLQPRNLQLPGFLNDFSKLRSRQMVPDERRMDNSGNGHRSGLTLNARLRKVSFSDQIGQALKKLAQINVRAVEVK
jgi:hypothetical protein